MQMQSKLIMTRRIWWITCAAVFTLLFGGIFISGIITNSDVSILGRFFCAINIFGLLAFWGLALQRGFLGKKFWQCFFVVTIAVDVLYRFFGPQHYHFPVVLVVIGELLDMFYLAGEFVYAFYSKRIWQEYDKHIDKYYDTYTISTWYDEKFNRWLKLGIVPIVTILTLALIPEIVYNNRALYACLKHNSHEYYQPMLEHRRKSIPEICEFEQLFPNYDCHFHYDAPDIKGDAIWEFTAGLYERYLVQMDIDIVFGKRDPDSGEITSPGSHSDIKFSLWEVSKVSVPPFALFSPRILHVFPKELNTISPEMWKLLVATSGDLSVLDVELKRNEPVPNFKFAYPNNEQKAIRDN